MPEPILKKVEGDGVQINLAIWEGAGKPILCIHGITANCRSWDTLAQALAPEYHVMAMDLRGRGLSDKPSQGYSLDYHLKDINCLLDDLGIDRVVIMGHSLGAFIGLAFAAAYPDRTDRLILVDGGGDLSPEQFEEVFTGIKGALDRLGRVFASADDYLNKMKAAPYIHPWSEVIETYYRYELEKVERGGADQYRPGPYPGGGCQCSAGRLRAVLSESKNQSAHPARTQRPSQPKGSLVAGKCC